MRILITALSTSGHQEGGMERHLDNLVKTLLPLGHEPHVLTTNFPLGKSWDLCAAHPVESQPCNFGREWWSQSRALFTRLHEQFAFNAILSEGYSAAPLASLISRPPIGAFLQGFNPEHLLNQWREIATWLGYLKYFPIKVPENLFFTFLEARFARSIERVWGIAPHHLSRFNHYYGVPSTRIELFHNWIDEGFTPAPEDRDKYRHEWGVGPADIVYIFNSVLSRQKGAHIALKSFIALAERRHNVNLIIVGDGSEKNPLEKEASLSPHRQRIRFLGHRPNFEIPGLLAAADVFVFPSLRIEGLPYTAMEACWVGLPCIGTRLGGTPEALGESALYVNPCNAADLAQAMERLAANTEERLARGQAARLRAHNLFSMENALHHLQLWLLSLNQCLPASV